MAHADAVEAIRPALKSRYHASLTMLPVMQFDAALTRDETAGDYKNATW